MFTKKSNLKKVWQIGIAALLILLLLPFAMHTAADTADAYIMRDQTMLHYDSLADALSAAQDGDTVYMNGDASLTETLVIDKAIVLEGNGYAITTSASRGINVSASATIQNLSLHSQSGERGINVIGEVVLLLDGVTVDGVSHYALNVARSGAGSEITVRNSNLSGWAAINVWGEGTEVSVEDTVLYGYNKYVGEHFGVVVVNDPGIALSVSGNSEIIAEAVDGAVQNIVQLTKSEEEDVDATEANVSVSGTVKIVSGNSQNTLTVKGAVAKVHNTYYGSLLEAIANANGETVYLLSDVLLEEALVLDKGLTLLGNGYTISVVEGYKGDRVVDIVTTEAIVLKNVVIDGANVKKAYGRGLNISAKADVSLEMVDIYMPGYYAVNLSGVSGGTKLSVKDSHLSGWATLNIWATGSTVTVVDSELVGVNSHPAHPSNRFGVITINDGTHTVSVTGQSVIRASSSKGSLQQIVCGTADVVNSVITLDATLEYDSESNTAILDACLAENNKLKVRAEYKEAILLEGYFVEAGQGGLVGVTDEEPALPPVSFDVVFNTNGGSSVSSQQVTEGGKATLPTAPTKAGYTFEGWYTDAALTEAYDFNSAVAADVTLYAKWTEVSVTPEPTPEPTPDPEQTPDVAPKDEQDVKNNGWVLPVVIVAVVLVGGGCLWFFVFKKRA